MTFRFFGAFAALGLLAACNTPVPVTSVTVAETPAAAPAASSASADPAASDNPGAPAQPGPSTPAPGATAAPAGGGASGGGSSGGVTSLPQILLSPDPLAPEVLAIPAGMVGQASVFVPDRVPSSIELDGTAVTLHPRVEGAVAEPAGGTATLTGAVSSGESNLVVQYVAKGRSVFVGGRTDGSGGFSVEVPMAPGATESGVLVVREEGTAPRLAIARVTLTDGQSAAAGTLSLASPLPPADPATYRVAGLGESTDASVPRPTAGLAFSGAALQLAESGASGPWRATVFSSSAAGLPSYAWPGFTPVVSFLASAADGLTSSETSGPAGAVPAFLAPPALGGVAAAVRPGTVLSWPQVAGAGLYTVRLVPVGQEDSPVWEGLVVRPQVTIPSGLVAPAGTLTLEVDAWDAPEVTPYSVASLRQLRIPTGPMGPTGRHSWSRRAVTFTP